MNKDIFVICVKETDKGIAKKILVDKLEKFIVKNMNKNKCYIELIDGNKIYFMTDYERDITYKGYRPFKCIYSEYLEDEKFCNLILKTLWEINKDKKWFKGER